MPSPSNNSKRPRYCYCGCGETLELDEKRFRIGHKPVGKARGPRDPTAIIRAQEKYRERHVGVMTERARRFMESNPDRAALYTARYRAKPEKRAARNARNRGYFARRRRQRDAPAVLAEAYALLAEDPCAYCGGPGGTVDHIVPLAQGGTHTVANLTGACKPCNGGKCDRPLLLFLLAQQLKSPMKGSHP